MNQDIPQEPHDDDEDDDDQYDNDGDDKKKKKDRPPPSRLQSEGNQSEQFLHKTTDKSPAHSATNTLQTFCTNTKYWTQK